MECFMDEILIVKKSDNKNVVPTELWWRWSFIVTKMSSLWDFCCANHFAKAIVPYARLNFIGMDFNPSHFNKALKSSAHLISKCLKSVDTICLEPTGL